MIEIRNRLSGAVLRLVRAETLRDAHLEDADLRYADLRALDLTSASFVLANLNGADLSTARLSGADFFTASLAEADLSGCDLAGAVLRHANLQGARLDSANLAQANLHGACLRGASLKQTSLFRTNLMGADLERAELSGADLTDVCFDTSTRWPAGFRPPVRETAPVETAPVPAGPVPSAAPALTRVLIVEDEPAPRQYLTDRLKQESAFRVDGCASSAGEALAMLRGHDIDLILLDHMLKESNGIELLRAINHVGALGDRRPPRVLFCTGLADEAFEKEARTLGAAGVVNKTDLVKELVPALQAVSAGGIWFDHGRYRVPRTSAGVERTEWRVLVVEDDTSVRRVISEVLPAVGCKVTLAWRGEDAVQILGRESFDLVILDHQLAGRLLGTQALEQIAARWPELPVLFLTALPTEVERYRSHPSVRGVISKPFRLSFLQSEIRRAVQE